MRNLFSVAVAAFAVFAVCNPVLGEIIIDDFSETFQRVTDPSFPGEVNTDEDALNPLEGVGKTRYVNVTKTSGTSQVSLLIDPVANQANYQAVVTARGSFTVGYDGTVDNSFTPNDATGLNLDLTGTHGLSILALADFGAQLLFTLYDGLDAYTANLIIPATGGVGSMAEYVVLYSAFVGPGTLDLTNIDAISIVSAPGVENAQDVSFTLLQTKTVPEPASILLLALGGLGCAGGAMRRRRQERTAAQN